MVDDANSSHLAGDFGAKTKLHVPPSLIPAVYVTVTYAVRPLGLVMPWVLEHRGVFFTLQFR